MNAKPHGKDALQAIERAVRIALQEDIGDGDVTAAPFSSDQTAKAKVICREQAVLCGQNWFNETFHQLDAKVEINWLLQDGDAVAKDTTVCTLQGAAQALLSGERAALNFLQTLSATATLTRMYVDRIAGTAARILVTRKPLHSMRYAQKYAVSCGGGMDHRMVLYYVILIKENHIAVAGSITKAVALAKQKYPALKLEVEVESNQQLEEAISTEVDIIMLDNFSLSELRAAVDMNNNKKLETSGNITLENIREIAKTGVHFISVGAITKNIQAVDFSMRLG